MLFRSTCLDSGESDQVVDSFFDNLELFPFYNELKNIIQASEQRQIKDMERSAVLSYLLEDKGLNFGFLPKGLIPFHADESGNVAKPISDHLEEACQISSSEKVFVHFTISPSHKKWFQDEVLKVLKCIEEKYQKNISVDYSFQEEVTNTVAVDLENKPFMLENGEVLRRPAGHGALLDKIGRAHV